MEQKLGEIYRFPERRFISNKSRINGTKDHNKIYSGFIISFLRKCFEVFDFEDHTNLPFGPHGRGLESHIDGISN